MLRKVGGGRLSMNRIIVCIFSILCSVCFFILTLKRAPVHRPSQQNIRTGFPFQHCSYHAVYMYRHTNTDDVTKGTLS